MGGSRQIRAGLSRRRAVLRQVDPELAAKLDQEELDNVARWAKEERARREGPKSDGSWVQLPFFLLLAFFSLCMGWTWPTIIFFLLAFVPTPDIRKK